MSKVKAIIYAVLAAAFYAVNVPISKVLLQDIMVPTIQTTSSKTIVNMV